MPPRVLVVDDEPAICRGIERVLTREQYQVTAVGDGPAALALLECEAFEVLLVDLRMPGTDGLTVLERALARHPTMVAVVITGYPALETAVEAIKRGAYDYIPKPFSPDELRAVVRRAFDRQKLQAEAQRLREAHERNLVTIAEERARLLAVLHSMTDGVLVVDDKVRLLLHNQAALPLFADEPQVGRPLGEVVHEPVLSRLVTAVLSGSGPPGGEEVRCRGRLYLATAAPVTDEHGARWGAVLAVRDVTPLYHLARVRANLVATVSHELRSPLAAIEGYLDLVLDQAELPEPTRRMLERCRVRVAGLQDTIRELLDISRLDDPHRERGPVAVLPVATAELEAAGSAAARAGVKLELQVSGELPPVLGNEQDLRTVLANLVDNAIKYNRPGGSVAVRFWPEPGYVVLAVEDNGIGIDSEHLPHIFEEFYRVRSATTAGIAGSGLGLAIVRKVAELHRCRLVVDSQTGMGTTVCVRWPVA